MKTTSTRLAVRISGVLLLIVAAARFVLRFFTSIQASRLASPDPGYVVAFPIDSIVLGLGAIGGLLIALSFLPGRNSARRTIK